MFEDTRPAELDAAGDADAWADFRIRSEAERLRVLRELRDGNVPVMLGSPGGDMLMTTLWALDTPQRRMTFSADAGSALLARLVAFDEAVAVAYCDSVKLQFDLHDLVLVRGATASVLQSALPTEIYRFQRRSAYRVRPPQRQAPVARLRHPSIPEMALTLRILDVSVGGCALCLPADVPPLQAGTELGELRLELDAATCVVVGRCRPQPLGPAGWQTRGLRMAPAGRPRRARAAALDRPGAEAPPPARAGMNSKRSKPGRPSGFTLVELCIAAGVVAVLAAVALPSYRGHLLHAGRVDAVAALTRLQAAQEQHRSAHGLYAAQLGVLPGVGTVSPEGR
jgi:prepilin-type N-terminal cleavage/methylation domain-containing protein